MYTSWVISVYSMLGNYWLHDSKPQKIVKEHKITNKDQQNVKYLETRQKVFFIIKHKKRFHRIKAINIISDNLINI